MDITYDVEKVNEVLRDFYNVTGVDADLFRCDFSRVNTEKLPENRYCRAVQKVPRGIEECRRSDLQLLERCRSCQQTVTAVCHAGMVDVAVPVCYEHEVIGYVLFGCMKPEGTFAALESYLGSLGLETGQARIAYEQVPLYDAEKIRSVSNLVTMFVKYMMLENRMTVHYEDPVANAVTFIQENLAQELSVQRITRSCHISKSMLYSRFRERFGCTVSEYIHTKRVERACELLRMTDQSMEAISQATGFSSASYFGRIFRKHMGTTPMKYRKDTSIQK